MRLWLLVAKMGGINLDWLVVSLVVSKIFDVLPLPGEMIQFEKYVSDGLKTPTS